ncbi:hypothetical protein HUK80_17525 [Flavobacterium sp. MAH-1]|uniref:RelA/SpoT domain-containing protein n=1 Tax=Flavobacterium agri TaxID=2743471 RepID=A0A7Y8Y5G5_9FLAO|nr:hypothetical protein [Flavobacterium agri]NUY82707.1 hypothetical protein [Flavobacterium agri]NYA72730.1 hypothetical protein [Flavobacterium agri]
MESGYIKDYKDGIPLYERLGKNVSESIQILLDSSNIKMLSVIYRVKEVESFVEKIERKGYEHPNEVEDVCGVRIICYYQKDVNRIIEILEKEFDVHESVNKQENLKYDQFGYRSHHVMASIKKDWEKTPNFKGLSVLRCEIQVRTVLMHAWAEIEHNLAYKNEAQTPEQFRRKLYRISAKLEEADEQFEDLKKESEEYRRELHNRKSDFYKDAELNIDSLQAFMDSNFPKRKKDIESTGVLLNELISHNISLSDLAEAWIKVKPHFSKIENDYWQTGPFKAWAQAGIARAVLDLTNLQYRNRRKMSPHITKIEQLEKRYLQ